MINRTKVKESTQIKPGDNGDVLVMKDNAPEWSTPSDADLAKASETDTKLAEKQDKLTAGDNIHIVGNTISADGKPTPIAIGTVTSGEVPMVSNSGTDTDVVLNFVLPKGDKGDKGDQGLQGPQGPVGAPFQVKKIYDSVEAMNADYSGSDVAVGEFVLIDTGDVQDPDNSKLYVKGTTQYDFVTDLSGAQGIQGPQGNPGTDAGFGNVTATVDNTTGTPQVSVQSDGPNTAKNISFSFTGLKGEKGEKGDPGEGGTQVNNIAPLVVSTPPTSSTLSGIAIGIGAKSLLDNAISIGTYAGSSGSSSSNTIAIGTQARGAGIAVGTNAQASVSNSVAIGSYTSVARLPFNQVALGAYSKATEENTVSVGSGDATMALTDDMDEETRGRIQARAAAATRRIVNVTDPRDAQDAATKNYVDTQLEPINAKLQYVPENTNQILSQIETNAEKAQSAAEAAQTTAESKANQSDLTALQTTVAQLQQTVTQLQATINNLTLETERI